MQRLCYFELTKLCLRSLFRGGHFDAAAAGADDLGGRGRKRRVLALVVAAALLTAAFQERHPDYRVEMVPLNGGQGLSAQFGQACRDGKVDLAPDLYFGSDPVRQRVLERLSPYLGQSGLDLGRLEHVAPWLRIDGELYGLPVWTWEEFRRAILAALEQNSQAPAGEAQLLNTRWAKWNGGSTGAGLLYAVAVAANKVLSGAATVDGRGLV